MKVRLKCDHLPTVLKIIGGLDNCSRGRLIERAKDTIEGDTPKGNFLRKKDVTEFEAAWAIVSGRVPASSERMTRYPHQTGVGPHSFSFPLIEFLCSRSDFVLPAWSDIRPVA